MNTLIKFQEHTNCHKYSKKNKKVQITRVPLESQRNSAENKRTGRNGPKVFLAGKEQYPPPNCDQSPIFKTKAVCCLPHGHILAHLSGQKCPQLTHVDFNK